MNSHPDFSPESRSPVSQGNCSRSDTDNQQHFMLKTINTSEELKPAQFIHDQDCQTEDVHRKISTDNFQSNKDLNTRQTEQNNDPPGFETAIGLDSNECQATNLINSPSTSGGSIPIIYYDFLKENYIFYIDTLTKQSRIICISLT